MKKLLLALILFCCPSFGRAVYSNWCQAGNGRILLNGIQSSTTTTVQRSGPSCTVTVYLSDGMTLATIYSNNSGGALSNPFTASSTGQYFFYADQDIYVIKTAGGTLPATVTFTIFMPLDGTAGGFITSLNGLTASTQTFATGTTGTDFGIVSSGSTHTFNIPTASVTNRGLLSSADWSAFNAKQGALSFTAPLVNTAGTVALTLPMTIAQGGTNSITKTTAFNSLSPLSTKGDILGFSGTDNGRLGVGTDTFCMVADSTQTFGFKWAACPGTSPITGATTNAIVTAASATTLQTNTNAPATDSSGNITVATAAIYKISNDTGFSRTSAGLLEVNSSAAGTIRDIKYRHNVCAGAAPTITTHFNSSSDSIAGGDCAGKVTVGTGAATNTGVITFGTAFTNAPACTAHNETTLAQGVQAVSTTTTLTLNGLLFSSGAAQNFTNSVVLSYQCEGY